MAIRAETTIAAREGRVIGMHAPTDQPTTPTGGDSKSGQIAAAINAAKRTYGTELDACNTSVDEIRRGLPEAAERITEADQQGAEDVENSTYI